MAILSSIVKEKSGLSSQNLSHLAKLKLIPRPVRVASGQGGAFTYPDTIFTRLHVIEFLKGHGFTLRQIVRSARGTPFEIVESEPVVDSSFPSWG